MIRKNNVCFAEELIDSIRCGLDKIKNGSEVEEQYLNEKIWKLYKLHGYTEGDL